MKSKVRLLPTAVFFTLSVFFYLATSALRSSVRADDFISVNDYIMQQLDSARMNIECIRSTERLDLRKRYYSQSRLHYKRIEWFVEMISPKEAKYFINGPLIIKYSEYAKGFMVEAHGYQVIEEQLFGKNSDEELLMREVDLLINQFQKLRARCAGIELDEATYLEMAQVQLFRIASLNLNGYDASYQLSNIQETAYCFEGLMELIDFFAKKQSRLKSNNIHLKLRAELKSAKQYLLEHPKYNSFDRLHFIAEFILPLNSLFIAYHDELELPWSKAKLPVSLQANNPFSEVAFDPHYFSVYYDDTLGSSFQAELGKVLFYDPVLSSNLSRACSSCHQPQKAFTDGRQFGLAFDKASNLERNVPSLIDVIFQKAFFQDGRAAQLEQQALDVLKNHLEMNSNLEDIVYKLRQSEYYSQAFRQAFPRERDKVISSYAIAKALSEYQKTLISFNSRFDQYLAGDRNALSEREKKGYNLFAGKALCATCHFFPVFNGTVPPMYFESEFEVLGTPGDKKQQSLSSDRGRWNFTRLPIHDHSFKTPTVRNAELTAPYMHNGVFTSLEEVLDFYDKGGGVGAKLDISNQTLPPDKLGLSKREKEDIILFIKSLSDTTGLQTRPFMLPLFESSPDWNSRTWGGDY